MRVGVSGINHESVHRNGMHGWRVCEFVGCDKRQRRHTMSVIRCACALLVTPYKFRIVNNWPTVKWDAEQIEGRSIDLYHVCRECRVGKAADRPRRPTIFLFNGGPALSLVPPYKSRCFTKWAAAERIEGIVASST